MLGYFFRALTEVMLLSNVQQPVDSIQYFQKPTIVQDIQKVQPIRVEFQDSIPNDTLYQNLSEKGLPISYFRKIKTGICFDDKCRVLNLQLYWNVTGRYLGFKLPLGEFLSKAEHEPFTADEYEELNKILADEHSALGGFTYNQLILKPQTQLLEVDGVTGATAPAIANYIVPGAVYTTYKLWHFTHGQAKEEVQKLTIKALNSDLIAQILTSDDKFDRIWVLSQMNNITINPDLASMIINMIDDADYSLSERALFSINPGLLSVDSLQLLLLSKLLNNQYSLQKLIIAKLNQAPSLAKQVTVSLAKRIESFSPEILTRVLDMFTKHQVYDVYTQRQIAMILANQNSFIAKKAYNFLLAIPTIDPQTADKMRLYSKD